MDKVARGQQYASTLLEKALARGPTMSRDTSQPTIASDSEEDLDTPGVGDMVASVLLGSTHSPANGEAGEGAAYQCR